MSMVNFEFHNSMPGMGALVNEVVARGSIFWGRQDHQIFLPGVVAGTARDAGNTGFTDVLRPGLLLGYNPTTRRWMQWTVDAVDGTQTVAGVLVAAQKMTNQGANQDRFVGVICVKGLVRAAGLSIAATATQGIVGHAAEWVIRRQMNMNFVFDDRPSGYYAEQTFMDVAGASTTITEAMAGTMFLLTGATNKTLVLPATPKRGLQYTVHNKGAGTVLINCPTADIITTINDDAADSVALSTANQIIGGAFDIMGDGVRWLVIPRIYPAQTVTVVS